ncbi:MAG TPA: hypothetical protein DET40_18410 [Lentisphaeria bacterium]|nr:MAG: hypothetical protein A2X45_14550 [Lentisphaerae bacterium GWF2_50_93]HCE45517.1 hypothetical protein [Lentisphaeria bacterium]
MLDTKGSDEAFVNDCARIMRAFKGKHREVVADWMPSSEKMESAYTRIDEIRFRLPYSELTEDQRKRNEEIVNKLKPMFERYKSKALMETWFIPVIASLEGLGKTPRERVEALIAKNDNALKRMKNKEDEASSLSSIDQAQNFMKDSLDWFGLMPDIPTLDCIKERCELNRRAVKSGVFASYRKTNGLPPPPESVKINGTDVPYDGGCYVMRYSQLGATSPELAKAYDNTEWKGKFLKSFFYGFKKNPDYILEVSMWQEKMFSPWYDTTRDYEWPISTEYLPMYWTFYVRNATRDNKFSRVKYEPGVTIVVLP